ncbi:MAG: DUF4845 domain-containing protein [Cellvibrio sp.]|nr:DUF4845 domain-containing protein [Cellvibrio sp.]
MKNNLKEMAWKNQKGMGALQWILVLLIAAFFLLLGFRVIPLYTENQYVIAGLKSLVKADENIIDMTDAEINKRMDNFYNLNNVQSDGPRQNIEIEREDSRVLITIDYEGKAVLFEDQPVVGTVSIVISFKNHLDSDRVHECCKPLKSK